MDPAVVTKPNLNSFCSELLSVVSSRSAVLLLVMLGFVVVEETCCCLLLWLAAVVAVADVIVVASLVARVEVSSSGPRVSVEVEMMENWRPLEIVEVEVEVGGENTETIGGAGAWLGHSVSTPSLSAEGCFLTEAASSG